MAAYRRIVVAVDGSAAAGKGLREAVRLAKSGRAQLVIVHVVNDFDAYAIMEGVPLGTDLRQTLREQGRRILDRAQAAAEREGVRARTVLREIPSGPTADAILREAKKQRADLIVLGTHGRRGLRRMILGSDAEQVVRTASVPVLLVR